MKRSTLSRLLDPRGLAVGRAAVGVSMLARPTALPTLLGVDEQSSARMAWVVQMLGAREVALAGGALLGRRQPKLWHAAGLLSDAVDAVAVSAALGRGHVRRSTGAGLVALATLASLAGAEALRRG